VTHAILRQVITETGAAVAVSEVPAPTRLLMCKASPSIMRGPPGQVIPELAGKLTGNAIRVPTPNVSLAVLVLSLQHATTVEEATTPRAAPRAPSPAARPPPRAQPVARRAQVNGYLRDVSINSPLAAQIDFSTSDELVPRRHPQRRAPQISASARRAAPPARQVSSDVIGARAPSVVDSCATIVQGERVNLYVWYDNEFGYSCQARARVASVSVFASSDPPRPAPLLPGGAPRAEADGRADAGDAPLSRHPGHARQRLLCMWQRYCFGPCQHEHAAPTTCSCISEHHGDSRPALDRICDQSL
jgi:hypothetical protein